MATGNHLGRFHHQIVCAASTTPSDFRRVLGVGPNASQKDVKSAYRRLALELHPDVCKSESSNVRFLEINRAYESLMHLMGSSVQTPRREALPDLYENLSKYSYYPPQRSSSSDDPWADFLQSLVKPEQSTENSTRASSSASLEGNW